MLQQHLFFRCGVGFSAKRCPAQRFLLPHPDYCIPLQTRSKPLNGPPFNSQGMARFLEYLAVDSLDSSYHVWNNFMSEVFFQAMLVSAHFPPPLQEARFE